MKRVVTIQDISCVGKCSLGVALPIISAAGAEVCPVPTAVLSAHTAFSHFSIRDLTEDLEPVFSDWEKEGLSFQYIYTGYLASSRQVAIVLAFLERFAGEGCTVFVDPVMGDFGRLYTGFDPEFAPRMAELCARADVIVPNLTEACALLGIPYRENFTWEETKDLLRRLCAMGPGNVVLTGVDNPHGGDQLGILKYNGETDQFFSYYGEHVHTDFPLHGTGDAFASACVGALAAGLTLDEALAAGVDYTAESVRRTVQDPDRRWYGVNFESALPFYIKRLGLLS